jgi:hypothetical protein
MIDIDSISGRELDALVVQRILDRKLDATQKAADGSPLVLSELPRFTEDPAMARGIEFTLEQRHPGMSMAYMSQSPFTVVLRGASGREYSATDESEATAICRAMVKAMDGEGPGIPRDQIKADSSPRAKVVAAEAIAARAQPHQPVGILAQAIAFQLSDRKEGPARALWGYVAVAKEIVPIVAEQLAKANEDIAMMCVSILDYLVRGGDAASAALHEAQKHPNEAVAKAATEAIRRSTV